ncbi:MAG: fructose-bisphosphate aldolase class I [Proteobacteria bacterium]|nr:fructose-bisphosphate aldolase class I [Pseudomonadota bacterium]
MNSDELKSTIQMIASAGKGILAADESTPTITKRFSALNITCTEDSRRQYRELLFTTPDIAQYICGVILYEETLNQTSSQGIGFAELLAQKNIIPGIKVDKGLINLPFSEEKTTQGLDGLGERLISYKKLGVRFAKWRAVFSISDNTPSALLMRTNAEDLARYGAICQEIGIVPIIEPEVLIDGNHTLEQCAKISEKVLHQVMHKLYKHQVMLEYVILKPSMVTPGKNCQVKKNAMEIAKATITVLKRTVPGALPTINFLSGGQTPIEATANLNAMHQVDQSLPWNVSFSFARALQEPCMKAWGGDPKNVTIAQNSFLQRCKLNSLASLGQYNPSLEKP